MKNFMSCTRLVHLLPCSFLGFFFTIKWKLANKRLRSDSTCPWSIPCVKGKVWLQDNFFLFNQGLEKEWPDLLALVTHHTVMSEMLPCTLRLPHKSKNPAYKDSEDGKKEDDPDYQRLSDFTSMMAALKNWPWFIFIHWAVCNPNTELLFIYLFCFFNVCFM